MLIVVNESVHLSKLCRAALAEHNCSTSLPVYPLLTLMSLAVKSDGTKSAPSDLPAFSSVQDSSHLPFLPHSQSHVLSEWRTAKARLLPNVFGTGRGHWWAWDTEQGKDSLYAELELCMPV